MDDHKQRGRQLIAKNSILNLAGQVLPMLTGVLTIPYIVRGLGTDGYGILSIAMMLLGYFNIFDLGLSRATVKFVAENLDSKETHKVPELIWTSLSLLVVLGCIGGAFAAFFVPVSVTHVFKMPPALAGQARIALFVLCASMPIMLGNNALRGVLEAAQRFDLVNLVKVPSSVLFYLVAALAIPFGVHVAGIVALMVGIRLISTVAYFWLCFRVIPGLGDHLRFSRGSLRPLAVFGGWIMVSNVANPIFGYLERFMIASILSVSTLTFYSAPYELVSKLLIFPMAIVPSLFPYFSYHGSKKSTEVSEVTSRTIKYLLLVFAPAIAIFFFFAHDIMQLWLGPTFAAQSTVVLQVITLVCVFNGLAYVPYTSVQALGRPDLKAIQDLVTLPVYAAFAWWFMHRYGINGAAFAKLVLTLIDCVLLYTFASRLKAFSFRDLISGPLFRAIVVSAALLAAVFLIRSSHVKLPVAAALTVFCFVVYAIAFWMVAVDEEDRNIISNIRHRVFAILPSRRGIASQTTGNRLNSLNARSTIDFMAQQAPLRITFLLPGYTWVPSGGFRVVYEYANQLVSLGHHVTVVHPRQLKFFSPAKRAIRERLHRARYDLMELFAIPAFDWHPIDERVKLAFVPTSAERYIPDADVLFATSWQTLQSVLRCSKVKGEKFYLIQGYETWMGPKDAVDQTWLSRTSKVVVARWLFDLGNSLGASNLTHIPNAVDHSRYRVIQPIPLRSRRVVMPISWVRIKGSADGIKALEIAKMKFPDLQVVLFGNSRRPSWIPGWMTHYDNPEQERIIEDLYNKSSIILSPSLTEGFPLPPAEGAACGCAIVATDIGGHREYVEDGVTGLLSPSGNPEALAENLCRLLGDDDLRIRLAYAASERMKQFSWKRSAALLEELVIGAVQGKSAEVRLAPVVPESALTTPLQAEGD